MRRPAINLASRALFARALITAVTASADPRVVISSTADPAYSSQKYAGARPRTETYVVMQGRYFDGPSVDHSIERMPFRHIAEIFAPELARRQYLPAKSAREADLLIVVHWGTTSPRVSTMEMTARTSTHTDTSAVDADRQIRIDTAAGGAAGPDIAGGMMVSLANEGAQLGQMDAAEQTSEHIANDFADASAARLLGYSRAFAKYNAGFGTSADEYTLRSDLRQERYFIILQAYDLHSPLVAGRHRVVWTMHLNMSSPGNNFQTALDRMSLAAVHFVGRTTDTVETVGPAVREGKVEIGPLVIVGEKK